MSGKPLKASLPERCESLLARLPALGPNTDYFVSVRVLTLLYAMRRQAATEPIDVAMMEEVIAAAMRARRLFMVELPDGGRTVKQHPASPRAPTRKH